jgi:hypothetical protein
MNLRKDTKLWVSELGAKNFLYASDSNWIYPEEEFLQAEVQPLLKSGDGKIPVIVKPYKELLWISKQDYLKLVYNE